MRPAGRARYWRDAEHTAERFRPAPAASRYGGIAAYSGDRVRRDAQGLLPSPAARCDDQKRGQPDQPAEIEDAALATGLVAEAVALGVADERLGQAVHLIARAAPGISGADTKSLAELLQELPNFMQPKVIHWRDAMPIGPNGKSTGLASRGAGGMKPFGPIPAGFGAADGVLAIGGGAVTSFSNRPGTHRCSSIRKPCCAPGWRRCAPLCRRGWRYIMP